MAKISAAPPLSRLTEALIRRIEKLPATLSFADLASEFGKPAGTLRQQHRRGTFPLRVQSAGGEKFVALADYLRFLETGEIQSQPSEKRKPGRPTNRAKAAAARQEGGANV